MSRPEDDPVLSSSNNEFYCVTLDARPSGALIVSFRLVLFGFPTPDYVTIIAMASVCVSSYYGIVGEPRSRLKLLTLFSINFLHLWT